MLITIDDQPILRGQLPDGATYDFAQHLKDGIELSYCNQDGKRVTVGMTAADLKHLERKRRGILRIGKANTKQK